MDGEFVVFKSKMVGFQIARKKNGAYFKADTN